MIPPNDYSLLGLSLSVSNSFGQFFLALMINIEDSNVAIDV